mmetsp:Transcript_17782/g.36805  ORF Transcript_17782/g.36805 Transcript_17782/m.36805 type:complete len:122 (-) Transcript_17782:288-653(-)
MAHSTSQNAAPNQRRCRFLVHCQPILFVKDPKVIVQSNGVAVSNQMVVVLLVLPTAQCQLCTTLPLRISIFYSITTSLALAVWTLDGRRCQEMLKRKNEMLKVAAVVAPLVLLPEVPPGGL